MVVLATKIKFRSSNYKVFELRNINHRSWQNKLLSYGQKQDENAARNVQHANGIFPPVGLGLSKNIERYLVDPAKHDSSPDRSRKRITTITGEHHTHL
ncbi:hypothetical protein PISMIDRAFT_353472 [Pisolithus microcarpus 441]|uniref:Uncharacterized protein n=1 Tax=Pisolithus microcarpus 441 TaxID=765257 RepID=A0A0C9ZSD2_9AGAM|nr:hypothetical protein PISMIDRAFT_353472 [Pisolithus microcarpus 441]